MKVCQNQVTFVHVQIEQNKLCFCIFFNTSTVVDAMPDFSLEACAKVISHTKFTMLNKELQV